MTAVIDKAIFHLNTYPLSYLSAHANVRFTFGNNFRIHFAMPIRASFSCVNVAVVVYGSQLRDKAILAM